MGVCMAAVGSTQGKMRPMPSAMGMKSTASTVNAAGMVSSRRRTTMYHLELAASLAIRKIMAAAAMPTQ